MASAPEVADSYYAGQKRISQAAALVAVREWRHIDGKRLDLSWFGILGRLLGIVTAAQRQAASTAPAYLTSVVRAQGATPDPGHRLLTDPFGGIASDGRGLDTLLYTPVAEAKYRMSQGATISDALEQAEKHLAMLVRTQVQDAGRMSVQTAMADDSTVRGYLRFVHLPCCPRCLILAGRFYRYSTGFQRHPNCLPAGAVVSGPARLATTRRWYEGELVVISTASGQELTVTGNHPVLTDCGWLPANMLNEGDHVIRSILAQGARPLVVPDEYQVPALIQDLWRPDCMMPLFQVPTTPEDFHGDGMDGQVNVVLADRLLRDSGDAPLIEPAHELALAIGVADAAKFAGGGTLLQLLDGVLLAADGLMRVGSLTGALLGGHPRGTEEIGSGLPARWDAAGDHGTPEGIAIYASRGVDLVRRLASQVERDRVVNLRRINGTHQVYNLTSAEGWFAANGLIVSNCDCTMMPGVEVIEPQDPAELLAKMRAEHPAALRKSLSSGDLQALDHGADLNQVVNAHRGMATAAAQATTEGTTKRGLAGKRLRGAARMTPAQIFEQAGREQWTRQQIVAQLLRAGYLI